VPRETVLNIASPAEFQISPAFFSLNYWTLKFDQPVLKQLAPLNFVVLRYGGETVEREKIERADFNWAELDRFILDCRALNVEPLIQVPYTGADPEFAASVVRYVNQEKNYDVRFWAIGNEPDKDRRTQTLQKWLVDWRNFRDAMKAVDPRILVFGPELASAYDAKIPANDWLTPFLQTNGDRVDVISLHRYPFSGNVTNSSSIMRDALEISERVRALRQHIQQITGREIPLAFTEMNLSWNWRDSGPGSSSSFWAALWMTETLGQMAESGVAMVNIWNAHSDDSLGLVNKEADTRRPIYYAAQMYAEYGDRVVPLASHVGNVTAHASRDSRTGNSYIVLVNRGRADVQFQLVLNSGEEQKEGGIYFDLNSRKHIDLTMPALSIMSIALDSQFNVTRTIVYSNEMYNKQQASVISTP